MPTYVFMLENDGKLPVGIRETLVRILPGYAGKKIRMTIEEAKTKRSLNQNDYYWAAIVPHVRQVRADNGDPVTVELCHEDLLSEFAPRIQHKKVSGEKVDYFRPMRSSEMNVQEMADYITCITAAMAQFGNPVPLKEGGYQ